MIDRFIKTIAAAMTLLTVAVVAVNIPSAVYRQCLDTITYRVVPTPRDTAQIPAPVPQPENAEHIPPAELAPAPFPQVTAASPVPTPSPGASDVDSAPAQEQAPSPKPPLKTVTINGTIRAGDTFATSLKRRNVPDEIRALIVTCLSKEIDFRRLKPSDRYSIELGADGRLLRCTFQSGPLDIYTVSTTGDGYQVKRAAVELQRRTIRIAGVIDSSLFASFSRKNEDMRLVYAFADIFSSRFDFNTETRKGDRYCLVFDKYYKDGTFVGYGKITAALYVPVEGAAMEAYYYRDQDGLGGYFDRQGQELGASFLRSPLPVGRVTSRFSYSRRHPITGVIKPHLGVDLAAPTGTPIMAAADGRVVSIGRNGPNGLQIILTHNGGYRTYYGHLSRFRKGLRKGDIVHIKEIIGYVGSTGMATGPHLDYRIKERGVFRDPFSLRFKPRSVLRGESLARFQHEISELQEIVAGADSTVETLRVSTLTVTSRANLVLL